MDPLILTDKDQRPGDDVVFEHIGRTKPLWLALFDRIRSDHPDLAGEWRYYNDGKSWLFKMQRKAKTIFWLGVFDGGFRTTFYFTEKASRAIAASGISPDLKKQFRSGIQHGKIRGVTILYRRKHDVEDALRLIEIMKSIR